jgi:drug/metabolite transporter (DMT)-like permease
VGLDGFDVAAIRCGAAGLVMLPWFMIQHPYGRGAGRTAWSHAVWLALVAGPLFTFASLGGFRFAPLPHGAVLQPSAMVLRSMLLSILFLGKRWRPLRLLGAAVIVLGLILIGGPAPSARRSADALRRSVIHDRRRAVCDLFHPAEALVG